MGFEGVFSTKAMDRLSIGDEAKELYDHVRQENERTLFSSFCPSWMDLAEQAHGDLASICSSCQRPLVKMGDFIRREIGDARIVAVSPCLAAKNEEKISNADMVLTTRELYQLLKGSSVDFVNIESADFDPSPPMTQDTPGAFGDRRIEAVLKAATAIDGRAPESIEFTEAKGLPGVIETHLQIAGKPVTAASVRGLAGASRLMDAIRRKAVGYTYIEVLACPQGCTFGGGQMRRVQEQFVITCKETEELV
jgi:NADH-quinone oxidoreductase subunit G